MTSHSPSPAFWRDKRVLVTGHTGFKGSWLSLWLTEMGAKVHGLALPPEYERCIFNVTGLEDRMTSHIGDLRDSSFVEDVINTCAPNIIFHLAAQALVRRAYTDPHETYSTNLLGLTNVLEATKVTDQLTALIVATSDKVYENREGGKPFTETDRLGGFEPYGVSKAAGELIVDAFRHSLGHHTDIGVATVRAGNVIGGGDWAADRLIPDAMAAFAAGKPLRIRNPGSTRPWQHVFEPLGGYLLLAEKLSEGDQKWRCAWNFGPGEGPSATKPVNEIAAGLVSLWNATGDLPVASWIDESNKDDPYEAKYLSVDSSKARRELGWTPKLSIEQALELTVSWYAADLAQEDMGRHALKSLHNFQSTS